MMSLSATSAEPTEMRSDSIRALTADLVGFRRERDWDRFHTPEHLAASVVIEAGELLECWQWGEQPTTARAADELADVAIYLLNLAEVMGIDLGEAITAKIARNRQRFPAE